MNDDRAAPISSLRDAARVRLFLWFFCKSCGHHGRFDPYALAQAAKRDMTFAELRSHLRCSRCQELGSAEVFPSDQMMPEPMSRGR
jgi:hypothetical protein